MGRGFQAQAGSGKGLRALTWVVNTWQPWLKARGKHAPRCPDGDPVNFLQRPSLPLDYFLWEHARGHDRRSAVLAVLAAYQNEDGGFAAAIEPDHFAEASGVVGACTAIEALRQIDCYDPAVPVVGRLVDHLMVTRGRGGRWAAGENAFDPTATCLGFLLRAGERVEVDIVRAVRAYVVGGPVTMPTLRGLMTLGDDMSAMGILHPSGFRDRIARDLEALLPPGPDADAAARDAAQDAVSRRVTLAALPR
jgi:hypothetical protein